MNEFMTRFAFVTILMWLTSHTLNAQIINRIDDDILVPKVQLLRSTVPIVLDGILDDKTWIRAQSSSNFSQYFPTDTTAACGDSEVYFSYDDDNLYVAAKCYAPADDFAVESLKRDYGFGSNDNITFLIDTYNDKTNAYMFGMNPYGARREALISNGGRTGDSFDPSWDNKWDGASKRYDNYWICELAIPFKTLRYNDGVEQWRFNAYRNDVQCNEISSWINIPRENILMDLKYMGEVIFEEPLAKPGQNISIIPFVSTALTRDFEDNTQSGADSNFSIGGDAKISLSSSLNLDLTINPDFSQVEVDRQVTNLDRFEIFFPERRQFFLENADLFGRFGSRRLNPFFSRRIGVSKDTITGNNISNTIYGGARLSGKLNDNLRVGLLNMVTAPQQENDLPTFNYTVAAAEHRIGDRSNLALIMVNKQAINSEGFGETADDYDRIVGLEYRIGSKNNYWRGKTSIMKAITPNDAKDKFAHYTQIDYNRRRYRISWEHQIIGTGFDAEVGFVPRKDILQISPNFTYRMFPKTSKISQNTVTLFTNWIYKLGNDDNDIIKNFDREENGFGVEWNTSFGNNHRFNAQAQYTNLTLLNDFDPTRIQDDDVFLAAGTAYKNVRFRLSYSTDRRKKTFFRLRPGYNRFFGGEAISTSGTFTYRVQPYASLSLEANYNHIDLGGSFETANLWLFGPRLDITFTKEIFLTTFLQYNNQIDNLSVNTRFQWRFAPASDLFIVYSDNYNTLDDLFGSRNRGVVAKLTYWLNL